MFYIFLRNYGTVEWNVDPGLESRFKHMQSGRTHLTSSTILDFDSQHSCIARRGIEGRGGEGRGGGQEATCAISKQSEIKHTCHMAHTPLFLSHMRIGLTMYSTETNDML